MCSFTEKSHQEFLIWPQSQCEQNSEKVTFGKGTQLHVLLSKCCSCNFLILTPTEFKVVLVSGTKSFPGSKTCRERLGPGPFCSHIDPVLGPSTAQPNTNSFPSRGGKLLSVFFCLHINYLFHCLYIIKSTKL